MIKLPLLPGLFLSVLFLSPVFGGDSDERLLSDRDDFSIESAQVSAVKNEHGSFRSDRPWILVLAGLDFPTDSGSALSSRRTYEGHGKVSLRAPISIIDMEAKYRYGLLIGDRYPTDHVPDQKRNMRGDFLIGLAFNDLSPRWRFVPRVGVHYSTLNYFLTEKGERNILAPEASLFWLHEQANGGLFYLNLSYIHLDKGNFSSSSDSRFMYGFGAEIGNIAPIGAGLGFLIGLEMEKMIIRDLDRNLHDKLNLLASIGLAY